MSNFRLLPTFFILLFCCSFLQSQSTKVSGSNTTCIYIFDSLIEEYNDLNSCLYVLKETSPSLDSNSILSETLMDDFLPYQKELLDEPYSIFWGRIKIQNNLKFDIKDWILRTGNGSYFDVFIYDSNQNPRK